MLSGRLMRICGLNCNFLDFIHNPILLGRGIISATRNDSL
jgi:hypothetical protein